MINAAEAYTYDGQNNLISLMGNQANTSTYTYDANGERLSKLNQTHTTQYYYDGVNLLFTKRNNSIDVRYLYDEGTLYAAIAADGLPYWYNVDLRGSVTNIIKGDTTGSITTSLNKSYVYDAYGNTDVTSTTELEHTLPEKELLQITLHWEHTLTPMLKMLVAASQECGMIMEVTILCLNTPRLKSNS